MNVDKKLLDMEPTTSNPVTSKIFFKVKGQKNVFENEKGELFINDGNGNMIPHDDYLKVIYREYQKERSDQHTK